MRANAFEIRLCNECGLRYPITEHHAFGKRCPSCLGRTRIVLQRSLPVEQEAGSTPRQLSDSIQRSDRRIEALLDNIRSAWNVGAIFRSSDGLGVSKLHLCGITSTPEKGTVRKTSLGAELTLEWEYSRNAVDTGQRLKNAGGRLVALEQDPRASSLHDIKIPDPQTTILVVGNEVTGVDPGLLDLCDQIIHIPMVGKERSLNVEVAFGIAIYCLLTRG